MPLTIVTQSRIVGVTVNRRCTPRLFNNTIHANRQPPHQQKDEIFSRNPYLCTQIIVGFLCKIQFVLKIFLGSLTFGDEIEIGEKKLSKVIVPDKWKEGTSKTTKDS